MATDRIYGGFQTAGVKVTTAAKSSVNNAGTDAYAELVGILGADGLTLATDANPVPTAAAGPSPSSTPITTGLVTGGASTGAGTAAVPGGTYIWSVPSGTFSGATLQLQGSPDAGVTYLSVTGAVLTAAGQWEVDIGAGELMRVLISGGPPSAIVTNLRKVA